MRMLLEWLNRARGAIRPRRSDLDLQEELRSHLEHARDAADRGARTGAAPTASGMRVGVSQAMDRLRDQRGLPWLSDAGRDVRYAWRMLAASPGFTAVVVLSLAIGIGVMCAVFSFADALLLRPLPIPRPGDVVAVGAPGAVRRVLLASYAEYVDVQTSATSFDGLAAFTESAARMNVEAGGVSRAAIGLLVSGNFFSVLDVQPQLGRAFRPDEDQVPGRNPVVILSHDFWEREFGGDASVLGRGIRLNGIAFTVIGVAPPRLASFDRYTRYQFYAPIAMWPALLNDSRIDPLQARDFRSVSIRGRLKAGVTVARAAAEVSIIARNLQRIHPDPTHPEFFARTEFQDRLAESSSIGVLMGMLGLLAAAVLFVACANVAGLLASRAPTRAREIALRLAIGAGRARVVRQLLTESALVALIGGVCSLAVSYAGVLVFRQWRIPTDLPIAASFDLDGRALMVSLGVALGSIVLFGLAPALRASRFELNAVMKAADSAEPGRRPGRGRGLLVGVQVSIAVTLLVVAAFVFRGFEQRFSAGPGFDTDHVLLLWFQPGIAQYNEEQTQQFFADIADRARLTPMVRSAALTSYVPMDGGVGRVAIAPEGVVLPAGAETVTIAVSAVDEHYFDTLRIPIVGGRAFRPTDGADMPRVAIVNEVFGERYWPGRSPIGTRFRLNSATGPWVEIVGVTKTAKYVSIIEPPVEFIYLPYRQQPQPRMALLAEAAADPSELAGPLREVVRRIDANQPVFNVRTLADNYRMRTVVIFNVVTELIAAMGAMGLALALVGLYGLVAYMVGRRTKEIGIRMAIGASQADILRMVISQGARISAAGLVAGSVASLGASQALKSVFPGGPGGDGRTDIAAFLFVSGVVFAVTLLAAYLPARRASRINPTEALRAE